MVRIVLRAVVLVALVAVGVALGAPGIASADVVGVSAIPATVDFGGVAVGQAAQRTVTLTNTGLVTAGLSVGVGAGADYIADSSACASVPAGGTCPVAITFSPNTVGSDNASATTFAYVDASTSAFGPSISLTGVGLPAVAVSPTGVNFGNVPIGASVSRSVTLTNVGGFLNALGVNSGSLSADFTLTPSAGCAGVFPGGSCSATVTFAPSAPGPQSGTAGTSWGTPVFGIAFPGPGIAVTGTGVAPMTLASLTTTPPAVSTLQTAAFAWSSPFPARFTCSLDGAAFAACSSPRTYHGLAAGAHSLCVWRALDVSPPCWSWTIVSPGKPVVSILGVSVIGATATPTFTSDQLAPTFSCSLDGAAYRSCSSGLTFHGLAAGSHTVRVQATNFAGDTSAAPAVVPFTV